MPSTCSAALHLTAVLQVLHFTAKYCTTLHSTSSHSATLDRSLLKHFAVHQIGLCCTTCHCKVVHQKVHHRILKLLTGRWKALSELYNTLCCSAVLRFIVKYCGVHYIVILCKVMNYSEEYFIAFCNSLLAVGLHFAAVLNWIVLHSILHSIANY